MAANSGTGFGNTRRIMRLLLYLAPDAFIGWTRPAFLKKMFSLVTSSKFRPINPALSFTSQQMAQLGAYSIGRIRARVARGIGSDDSPMLPLRATRWAKQQADGSVKYTWKSSYANAKIRMGLQPIRDLYGAGMGGHMLDNISVRSADTNSVRIDITGQSARVKASANEKKASWYGWSPSDAAAILDLAMQAAHGNISEVTAERGLSIWMDPLRLRSRGYQTALR